MCAGDNPPCPRCRVLLLASVTCPGRRGGAGRHFEGVAATTAHEKIGNHAAATCSRARGRGVGKALLDTAKARSDRLELWCFQANAGARRFYAREGLAEVERTDGAGNDEKLPDVRLVWPAPAQGEAR